MEEYFGDDIITKDNMREAIEDAIADGNLGIANDIHKKLEFLSDHSGGELILDEYFEEDLEQSAIDNGDISEYMSYYVNWTKYADAVKTDYSSVDLGTLTYWIRK